MDLRKFNLTPKQIERAKKVLNYQPFIAIASVREAHHS